MLFSTMIFLFVFLPIVLVVYFILLRKNRRLQNGFLTICSLYFYAYGEPWFVLVMIASIIGNWLFALWIDKRRDLYKWILLLTITMNFSILFVFKYLTFILTNMKLSAPIIELPIGISFFTFQAVSYVIDVYRRKGEAQKNPLAVALYISFFPQLIAGPIVRYETIAEQIKTRKETFDDVCDGMCRFIIGLAKKMILANNLALVADTAFSANDRTILFAWMGAIAYTFQIFYDFSGYSDMAIGLGKMFGFHFLENFNYPYISSSISEFWRRWHISLGTWFRDYVYFPLGGSRVTSKIRLIGNLFAVWFLTGIWHGANWTFLWWGLLYFFLITTEKLTNFPNLLKGKLWLRIVGHVYTLFFVVIGWVLFRANSVNDAILYIKTMFGIEATSFTSSVTKFWFHENQYFYLFAIIFSLPIMRWIVEKLNNYKVVQILYPIMMMVLFTVACSYVVKGGYNPFIYFNF